MRAGTQNRTQAGHCQLEEGGHSGPGIWGGKSMNIINIKLYVKIVGK